MINHYLNCHPGALCADSRRSMPNNHDASLILAFVAEVAEIFIDLLSHFFINLSFLIAVERILRIS